MASSLLTVHRSSTIALVLALLAPLAGCVRIEFDLCRNTNPHPDCDGGRPSDAGPGDAGPSDTGPLDGPWTPPDGWVFDAGTLPGLDAGPDADADPRG